MVAHPLPSTDGQPQPLLEPGLTPTSPITDQGRQDRRARQKAARMTVADHEPAPVDWAAARTIRAESEKSAQEEIDPTDPQAIVAAAINDVIELARAMSAQGLDRGVVEMRRRLRVMDMAIATAEQLTGPAEGTA